MLPLQLLRVQTKRGMIFPVFCGRPDDNCSNNGGADVNVDLQLATQIIQAFEDSAKNAETKRKLDNRLAIIEAEYDDYKLVRGFAALLERRCRFDDNNNVLSANKKDSKDSTDARYVDRTTNFNQRLDSVLIRRALFEESAKTGFALTELERESIIEQVAVKMGTKASYIKLNLWNDLDENAILTDFERISPEELLKWYNLSSMQTLLFNCTKLAFSVRGGTNWKRVLRNLKKLRLMYELQRDTENGQRGQNVGHGNSITEANNEKLVCIVDGPLSIFKMTDRYGTSIAKLLPSIILADEWNVHAWIIRKTFSGRKIFEFKISSSDLHGQLLPSYYLGYNSADDLSVRKGSINSRTAMKPSQFDSIVEEKFAKKFEQSTAIDWKLAREPDPIVLSDGTAFIPDFVFEKYGRKVYFEIVGFWTKQYLERKARKLADAFSKEHLDMLVAVDENLECSKIASWSAVPKEKVIWYRNGSVDIGPIINHLRKIDRIEIDRHAKNTDFKIKLDSTRPIISAKEIADQHNIPIESAIIIASRENDNDYLLANSYFILKSKAEETRKLLERITKFSDACAILSEQSIPEPCHAELISKLGYEVRWQSMDVNDAVIVRRESTNSTCQ